LKRKKKLPISTGQLPVDGGVEFLVTPLGRRRFIVTLWVTIRPVLLLWAQRHLPHSSVSRAEIAQDHKTETSLRKPAYSDPVDRRQKKGVPKGTPKGRRKQTTK
jgi:hypothetical protein